MGSEWRMIRKRSAANTIEEIHCHGFFMTMLDTAIFMGIGTFWILSIF
ncbi:hypothetical protein [Hydrogenimonas sp.]